MDLGILLGLMVQYVSEKCEFLIFSSPSASNRDCYLKVEGMNQDDILKNVEIV